MVAVVLWALGALAVCVVVAVGLARVLNAEQRGWASVASELGLTFDPAKWSMRGKLDGQPVQMRLECRSTREHSQQYLVFEGLVTPALDLGLRVTNMPFRGYIAGRGAGAFPAASAPLGEAEFDDVFLLHSDEPERARALLDAELRSLVMQAEASAVAVEMSDGRFVMEIDFRVAKGKMLAPTLRDGLKKVAHIARSMHDASARIPAAGSLVAHRTAWRSFAEASGLQTKDTPLWMGGELDGVRISAHAVRTGPSAYAMDVTVEYSQPLAMGLLIRPAGMLDAVGTFFGGQDEKLGDAAFDDAFVVKVERKETLARVVDKQVRARLMELHEGPLAVQLRDDAVVLRSPQIPEDPTEIPRLVAEARSLARRLIDNTRERVQAGPYR